LATHQPPEVRRAQILAAALVCFGEKGLHTAKIDDIARGSGLSKGAIYFHFASKDDIFLELFAAFERELLAEWDRLPEGPALDTLKQIGEITLTRIVGTRALLDLWTEFLRHPTSRERLGDAYRQARERIANTVRAGTRAKQLRRCDPEHVAGALTGLVEGLLVQAFADPDYDALAAWPTAWEITARGLAA
jgi:AcrR family transcriptional regulator